jgi:drug/metabolite transporter (DMT)-like permease
MLIIVAVSLGAAVVYGASDFLGGSAARRLHLIRATTLNYAVATVVVLGALVVIGGAWTERAGWTGGIAGLLAIAGLIAFYAVLAIGPMSLLSPIIALVESVVPVAVAASTGQGLSGTAWLAIGIAVVAIILMSPPPRPGRDRISARGAALALFSGLTLGGALVALDFAPKDSGVVPAFWEIATGLVVLLALLLVIRVAGSRLRWLSVFEPADPGTLSARRAWFESAGSGLLVGIANCLIVIGFHLGNLAVVAVLVGLYPVITVILAATVLKEKMSVLQFVGIGLVIVASLLLSVS